MLNRQGSLKALIFPEYSWWMSIGFYRSATGFVPVVDALSSSKPLVKSGKFCKIYSFSNCLKELQ